MVTALTSVPSWRGLLVQHAKEWFIAKHQFLCYEWMLQSLYLQRATMLIYSKSQRQFYLFVCIRTSFHVLQQTTPIEDKSRLMRNKDLVSCCLSYSANAKTAILQYLNCKSKVNVKKIICQFRRCFMRLQAVTFAQGLCSYLEFIQREYSSNSFSRAPK